MALDCGFEVTIGERQVEGIVLNQTGNVAVVASSRLGGNIWDGELRLLSLVDGEGTTELVYGCAQQVAATLSDVTWVSDSKTLATSSDDGNVYVYSLQNLDDSIGTQELCLQSTYGDHDGAVTALSMDSPNRQLYSASVDGVVRIWDVAKPDRPVSSLQANISPMRAVGVLDVMVSPSTGLAVSAHQDNFVRFWDTRATGPQGKCVQSLPSANHGSCLTLSNSIVENQLACGYEDGTVCLVDVRKAGEFSTSQARRSHAGAVQSVQLAPGPQGLLVFSGGQDGRVVAEACSNNSDASKGQVALGAEVLQLNKFHGDYVKSLAVRPSRQDQILTGGWDGHVKLVQPKAQ